MQDDLLVEIKTEIGVLKHDTKNLFTMVEKLAVSVEKITESLRNDHHVLRAEYNSMHHRVIILEHDKNNKKHSLNVWVAPVVCAVVGSILTNIVFKLL